MFVNRLWLPLNLLETLLLFVLSNVCSRWFLLLLLYFEELLLYYLLIMVSFLLICILVLTLKILSPKCHFQSLLLDALFFARFLLIRELHLCLFLLLHLLHPLRVFFLF